MECGELRVMQNSTTIGVCKSSREPPTTLSAMDDRGSPTSYNLDGILHHLYWELGGDGAEGGSLSDRFRSTKKPYLKDRGNILKLVPKVHGVHFTDFTYISKPTL